jgi:hypothetical protein
MPVPEDPTIQMPGSRRRQSSERYDWPTQRGPPNSRTFLRWKSSPLSASYCGSDALPTSGIDCSAAASWATSHGGGAGQPRSHRQHGWLVSQSASSSRNCMLHVVPLEFERCVFDLTMLLMQIVGQWAKRVELRRYGNPWRPDDRSTSANRSLLSLHASGASTASRHRTWRWSDLGVADGFPRERQGPVFNSTSATIRGAACPRRSRDGLRSCTPDRSTS